MIRIIDKRQTGKTTKLIKEAKEIGATIVVPTFHHKNFILQSLHGDNVPVITFHEFLAQVRNRSDVKYLIDELDICLDLYGVKGYTNSIYEGENQNGSKEV